MIGYKYPCLLPNQHDTLKHDEKCFYKQGHAFDGCLADLYFPGTSEAQHAIQGRIPIYGSRFFLGQVDMIVGACESGKFLNFLFYDS